MNEANKGIIWVVEPNHEVRNTYYRALKEKDFSIINFSSIDQAFTYLAGDRGDLKPMLPKAIILDPVDHDAKLVPDAPAFMKAARDNNIPILVASSFFPDELATGDGAWVQYKDSLTMAENSARQMVEAVHDALASQSSTFIHLKSRPILFLKKPFALTDMMDALRLAMGGPEKKDTEATHQQSVSQTFLPNIAPLRADDLFFLWAIRSLTADDGTKKGATMAAIAAEIERKFDKKLSDGDILVAMLSTGGQKYIEYCDRNQGAEKGIRCLTSKGMRILDHIFTAHGSNPETYKPLGISSTRPSFH